MLLCGGAVLHYHSINNNQKLFSKAGLAEGYGVGSAVFNNNIRLPEFDNMTIQIPVKENHVISNGVKEVIFLMSNRLTKYPANAEILLNEIAGSYEKRGE